MSLKQAVEAVRRGGVVAYPTEAVYGLGCDPMDEGAVGKLLAIKGRPISKGLILIAGDFKALAPYLQAVEPEIARRAFATWPGPVTWLWPASPKVPLWLRGAHDTLAVRVTAHPLAALLCRILDMPLVSTSANPGGAPPARCASEVRAYFGTSLDGVLEGEVGDLSGPTPILDLRTGKALRPGAGKKRACN